MFVFFFITIQHIKSYPGGVTPTPWEWGLVEEYFLISICQSITGQLPRDNLYWMIYFNMNCLKHTNMDSSIIQLSICVSNKHRILQQNTKSMNVFIHVPVRVMNK